jgi:hypothetical protein
MQLGPWFLGTERLKLAGQIPVTAVAGGEGKPIRNVQGTRAVLTRVMCRSELAGGAGTAVNQGGGYGAQPWRRCSGVMAHRRWMRGGGKAPGE